MTRICPKCNYLRKETDSNPEWQCPSCQVAYNKVGGMSVSSTDRVRSTSVAKNEVSFFTLPKLVLLALCLGLAFMASKPLWQAKKIPHAEIAAGQPTVILYGTDWCGYCAKARSFFKENGIQYTDLDVEKTTEGYEGHKKAGGNGVPVIVIGDQVLHGYSEEQMRNSLAPWLKS